MNRDTRHIADKYVSRLRSAITYGFQLVRMHTDTLDLQRALRDGTPINDVIPWARATQTSAITKAAVEPEPNIADTIHDLVVDGWNHGAEYSQFFNLINPQAVAFAQQYTGALITGISQSSRDAIQSLVANGLQQGIDPGVTAKLIRDSIGLTQQQSTALEAFRSKLEGQGAKNIDSLTQGYADRLLAHRADVIAHTETMRAANRGVQLNWHDAKDAGVLPDNMVQQWIVTDDDTACDECMDYADATAPVDEPFDGGEDGPPLHPSCRCTIGLTEGDPTDGSSDVANAEEDVGDEAGGPWDDLLNAFNLPTDEETQAFQETAGVAHMPDFIDTFGEEDTMNAEAQAVQQASARAAAEARGETETIDISQYAIRPADVDYANFDGAQVFDDMAADGRQVIFDGHDMTERGEFKANVAKTLADRMPTNTEDLVRAADSKDARALYEDKNAVWARMPGGVDSDGYPAPWSKYYDSTFGSDPTSAVARLEESGYEILRGGTPEAQEYSRELATSKLVNQWANTSNDQNAISLAIQDAVQRVFGLDEVAPWEVREDIAREVAELNDLYGHVFEDFVRAQYEQTQERLDSLGVHTLTLGRGFNFTSPDYWALENGTPPPDWFANAIHDVVYNGTDFARKEEFQLSSKQDVLLRPISSFSSSINTVNDFTGGEFSGYGAQLLVDVPAQLILASPLTGVGCLNEFEFVIIGGNNVMSVLPVGSNFNIALDVLNAMEPEAAAAPTPAAAESLDEWLMGDPGL